mgnify:CR=1 FL=1
MPDPKKRFTTTITVSHDDEADLITELEDVLMEFIDGTIENHELMDGTYQVGNCCLEISED